MGQLGHRDAVPDLPGLSDHVDELCLGPYQKCCLPNAFASSPNAAIMHQENVASLTVLGKKIRRPQRCLYRMEH